MRLARIAFLLSVLASTLPLFSQTNDAQPLVSNKITEYSLPPDKLEKAHALYSLSTKFEFFDAAYGFAILIAALFFGAGAKVRNYAERFSQKKWLQGLIVIPLLAIAIEVLTIPTRVYHHHI